MAQAYVVVRQLAGKYADDGAEDLGLHVLVFAQDGVKLRLLDREQGAGFGDFHRCHSRLPGNDPHLAYRCDRKNRRHPQTLGCYDRQLPRQQNEHLVRPAAALEDPLSGLVGLVLAQAEDLLDLRRGQPVEDGNLAQDLDQQLLFVCRRGHVATIYEGRVSDPSHRPGSGCRTRVDNGGSRRLTDQRRLCQGSSSATTAPSLPTPEPP